jgi:hypothetical protein
MMGSDHHAAPLRLLRTHSLPEVSIPPEQEDAGKPFALVTVCLWSTVGIALTTFLIWLALGGHA